MWTTRFIYFDSKCMHLSKLLHNLWSTFFVLIYLLSGRNDNRKTVYVYIYIYKFSNEDVLIELYKDIEREPLVLHTLTRCVYTCQITVINEWLTFNILIKLYKDILIGMRLYIYSSFIVSSS